MQHLINESLLKLTTKKILTIIKNHEHKADQILETEAKKILTKEEREKVSRLVINDTDGTRVLHNDGSYKAVGSVNLIDDTQIFTDKTYSSYNLKGLLDGKSAASHNHKEALDKKADKTELHQHSNKNVLDDISLTKYSRWEKVSEKLQPDSPGLGTKVLFDDLTFKEFTGGSGGSSISKWKDLIGKPYDSIAIENFKVLSIPLQDNTTEKQLFLKYPTIACTKADYLKLKADKQLDINTIYIIIDDNTNTGSGNESSIIITDGDGTAVLCNDGTYKKIMDDTLESSSNMTYSIDKIKDSIDHKVTDAIANATDTSMRIWQKTKLNVRANDTFDALTTENDILTTKPLVVQGYKFVEGKTDIIEVIKDFNNGDEANFFHTTNAGFDGVMKIKDTYPLGKTLMDDGYYRTEVMNKNDFLEIYTIRCKGGVN